MRAPTDVEHEGFVAGLRLPDAFVLRRCKILVASARGRIARVIASDVGRDGQTVRTAIAAFNAQRVNYLQRSHTIRPAFDVAQTGGCAPCSTRARAPSTNPPVYGPCRWPPQFATNGA